MGELAREQWASVVSHQNVPYPNWWNLAEWRPKICHFVIRQAWECIPHPQIQKYKNFGSKM